MSARLRIFGKFFVGTGLLLMSCGNGNAAASSGSSGPASEAGPQGETAAAPAAASVVLLPLFDAHAHQMSTYPDGWLESLFTEHNPLGMVLLGTGNVFTHQENYPGKVFAFSNFRDVDAINFGLLESQLDVGFRGIGEVSIRHFPSGPPNSDMPDTSDTSSPVENDFDEPDLLAVYDKAKEHGVPVIFHFDYDTNHVAEISDTLPDYPEVTFIWAHAGDAQPLELWPLLAAHTNLHLDISSRNPLESFEGRLTTKELQRLDEADGTLKNSWKELFTEFADRIYFGSDIGPPGRLQEYSEILDYYRGILGQLESDVAKKIAYENARELFGLSGGHFESISISGSMVFMDFAGEVATVYQLQFTPDPASNTWTDEGSPQTTDEDGQVTFTSSAGSAGAFRAENP